MAVWAVAAVLFVASILDGCDLASPDVFCVLSADDCERAIAVARDLSPQPWSEVRTVQAHFGVCVFEMSCPIQAANDEDWISVELHMRDAADDAFITIDRGGGDWSANCQLWIRTANGAHTEPCPSR